MIIGDPMSCKTEAYKILSEALTHLATPQLNEGEEAGPEVTSSSYQKTSYKIINPKSMTMPQLYGSFDEGTHEWTDGVLGRTFRDMATAATGEIKS